MCIVKQLRKSFYILLLFLICNLLGVILFYFYDYAIDHLWHNVFGISKGARGFITIFITGVMSLFDLVIAAGFLVPAVLGYYCLLFNICEGIEIDDKDSNVLVALVNNEFLMALTILTPFFMYIMLEQAKIGDLFNLPEIMVFGIAYYITRGISFIAIFCLLIYPPLFLAYRAYSLRDKENRPSIGKGLLCLLVGVPAAHLIYNFYIDGVAHSTASGENTLFIAIAYWWNRLGDFIEKYALLALRFVRVHMIVLQMKSIRFSHQVDEFVKPFLPISYSKECLNIIKLGMPLIGAFALYILAKYLYGVNTDKDKSCRGFKYVIIVILEVLCVITIPVLLLSAFYIMKSFLIIK